MSTFEILLSRWTYLNWIALMWLSVGGFVISCLAYSNILCTVGFFLLSVWMPFLYQIGLTVADFETCSKMFEWDDENEDEDDPDS